LDKSSAAEVIFIAIPGWKTIQLLLTLSVFSSIKLLTYTKHFRHREGW